MAKTPTETINITKEKMKKNKKLALVASSGGHLSQLYLLKETWSEYDRFWVSFDKEDANALLKDEKLYHCYYPTNRNVKNTIKNTWLALKLLIKEKPDVIISTGAAIAVPFFYIGKLFGCKTIYVEIFDRIDTPTMTGKLVQPIATKTLVQWESMKKVYPKSENIGGIF